MSTKQVPVRSGRSTAGPGSSATDHTARALAVLRVTTGLVFLRDSASSTVPVARPRGQ